MKPLRSIAISFMLAIFCANISHAQTGNHYHALPQGGVVQEANGYHIEMVKTKDTLNFYLPGADGKASKKTAFVMLNSSSPTKQN